MTYVMEMSTNADIVNTGLNAAWNPITARYHWAQIQNGGQGIPAGATIVVIAHGNGDEIGNAVPGVVDITAEAFLAVVHTNMAAGSPAAIYLSTCSPGIAQFTAAVRIAAQNNNIWAHTRLYGHNDAQIGPVPAPRQMAWTQIF